MTDDEVTGDGRAVWDAMRAVYAGFLSGDSAAADAHLHPDVTIWDSAEPGLVRGLGELRELRGRRRARPDPACSDHADSGPAGSDSGPRVVAIEATEPVVDVWGDTAVLRHLLRVTFGSASTNDPAGPAEEVVRNTSVWRRVGDRWLAVHNHEDVLRRP